MPKTEVPLSELLRTPEPRVRYQSGHRPAARPTQEAQASTQANHPLLDDSIVRKGDSSRPVINQGNTPTCGHNCAAMVLNQQGRYVNVNQLIYSMPPSPKGITVYQVRNLLRQNGLDSRFLPRKSIDDIRRYTASGKPVIVRIESNNFSHFVIVDGVTNRMGRGVVAIRDPHGVQYFSPIETFSNSFTGDVIFTK